MGSDASSWDGSTGSWPAASTGASSSDSIAAMRSSRFAITRPSDSRAATRFSRPATVSSGAGVS